MRCEDAAEELAALTHGERLTTDAHSLAAHLWQCADCCELASSMVLLRAQEKIARAYMEPISAPRSPCISPSSLVHPH